MYDVTKVGCRYDLFRATSLFRPPARVSALSFRPALMRKQRNPDVKQVDQGRDGQRIVILENGQVWAQTGSHSSGYLKAGDLVQVRKGLVGGYALVMSNGVTVRVRRTR